MKYKKINIGILGGSFNPCHKGHIHISKLAFKSLKLKQVWWVVSPQNPLKSLEIKGAFQDRLQNAVDFTKNDRFIKVTDLEYKLLGNSKKYFSINLIRRLKQKYKNYNFYFIIGVDNLVNLHKWHKWKSLINDVDFVSFDRGEEKYKALKSKAFVTKKIKFIYSRKINISSTILRNI